MTDGRFLKTPEWLSRDPIEEDGGINLYGYVGNGPVNSIDPLGLDASFIFSDGTKKTAATAGEFQSICKNAAPGSISKLTIEGTHGTDKGQSIDRGDSPSHWISISKTTGQTMVGDKNGSVRPSKLDDLLSGKLASGASIEFEGCGTGDKDKPSNLAQTVSKLFKDVPVKGSNWYTLGIRGTNIGVPLGGTNTYMNGQLQK